MILAADIGGTSCKMGLFDSSLELLEKWRIRTETGDDGTHILNDIHLSFKERLASRSLTFEDCTGVGFGVPGPVDFESGTVNGAINLNWSGFKNIKEEFEALSSLNTIVDNDANLAALGEQSFGSGQNYGNTAMFTLGTGVGGGIIIDGLLVHGSGSGGELGHIKVAAAEGFKCNCGGTGCLESVASSQGLKNLARKYYSEYYDSPLRIPIETETLSAKAVFDSAHDNDELGLFLVEKMSLYLGIGLSSVAVTTNPSHIILGGGLSHAGEYLREKVQKYFEEYAFPPAVEGTQIVLASLGNDAGIYGAAKIVSQYKK